jgi:uncharacterized coiled-coil protein SlyX
MRNRNTILIAILSGLACFGLLSKAQEVPGRAPAVPALETPDPGSVGGSFNTADGQNALGSVTTGAANSAFGWFSLFSNTDGSFNTAVGAGTLLFNTIATENTAVGAAALLNNVEGMRNTAIGSGALVNNTDDSNTAIGSDALGANTTGTFNVGIGGSALIDNTEGDDNTAIGVGALSSNTTGSGHTVVGRLAGAGLTAVDNNVIIGNLSGVHPDPGFGQISDRCFIDNIHGAPVSSMFDPQIVLVDSAGRLGTAVMAGADRGGFFPNSGLRPAALQGAHNAMLNRKVEELQATIAQQQKQIETLTTGLQKVSAQLDTRRPATKVVFNKP